MGPNKPTTALIVRRMPVAFSKLPAATKAPAPSNNRDPLPVEQWPAWTFWVTLARQSQDIGLGDTVVHIIGDTRSVKFKTWFAEKFGTSCGCSERQSWLNKRYPYPDFIALQTSSANDKTNTTET